MLLVFFIVTGGVGLDSSLRGAMVKVVVGGACCFLKLHFPPKLSST